MAVFGISKCRFASSLKVFLAVLCVVLFSFRALSAENVGRDVFSRLSELPGVTDVDSLESATYGQKFLVTLKQPLDLRHPDAGSFEQRIIVAHVGYDRPTVLVTEGYDANYAINANYKEELSLLLQANLIFVEYRFFGESMPEPCDWSYLTVENSVNDLHRIRQIFGEMYAGKWISTGISKGGETTIFYRTFYPEDVDISVPYVAPLNRALEDGRHEPFIAKKVSTKENRKRVKEAQVELLKRKDNLMGSFEAYCKGRGYKFRIPLREVYDYCVLEYAFAFWQWGTPVSYIPKKTDSDEKWLNHLLSLSEPSYFSLPGPYLAFNVQAAKEIGYYGYDIRPFRKYLDIKSAHDYLRRVMLPADLSTLQFDSSLYERTKNFLENTDFKMICIYGGDDPWTASGLTWLKKKKQIHVYVLPAGSHSTRIASFDKRTQDEIKEILSAWLNE